jgi:hypothetical protein
MNPRITNRKQILPNAFSAGVVLFFIVLYAIQGNRPETLHHFFHQHEAQVTHSQEEEQDACHQSIYHATTTKGCEHPLHIVANDPCPACDLYFHTDHYIPTTFAFSKEVKKQINPCYSPAAAYSSCTLHLSSRAPPMI